MIRALTTLLALLVLSGCGFHLRGALSMPFASAYIDGGANNPVVNDLRRQLAVNGVTVAEAPKDAEVRIRILSLARERDILSLDAAGKAREYRLFYRLAYAVDGAQGTTLATPAQIALRRDITFSSNQLLAKSQEEELLYEDMEDDLVQQLMRRLAALDLPPATGQ